MLGIDPGAAVVGYGLVESGPGQLARLIECGIIRTGARDSLAVRLRAIHDEVAGLIRRLGPQLVAVEGIFMARNVRTTVVLGHARGVILLAAEEASLPIAEYSPALIKKAVVGRGAAVHRQVGFMVAELLRLKTPPTPADAADGVAVALTHLLLTAPRLGREPKGSRR